MQTWKLLRARIVKHVSGPFNAKGSDVAMEELTLAYERLELEQPGAPLGYSPGGLGGFFRGNS